MISSGPIRVVAVSYVNTYPFLHGLEKDAGLQEAMELRVAMPSECARLMTSGEADLGLMPVAAIGQVPNARVVTDFCIGADGPVDSVCLFSDVPLHGVQEVLLDHQSRTSVQLMRILAQRHFGISPRWTAGDPEFIGRIAGATAGVVIGDRAFGLREKYPVVIDLAEEWGKLTGLPFVFACWVANRELPPDFLDRFGRALQYGVDHRADAIAERSPADAEAMTFYVNHRISYVLDDRKREAMELFTRWSQEL